MSASEVGERGSGWAGIKAALAQPNYRLFTLGSAFSLVGLWAQRVAISWLVWELTESSFWLGIVAMADLFPMVLIAPIAGVYADRIDRMRTTRISQALLSAQGIVLFSLAAYGAINLWALILLTLFGGLVTAFNQPARMALLPALLPAEHLPAAVAINSIVFNLARFVGPAMAGLLLSWSGAAPTFLVAAIAYAVFVVFLYRIEVVRSDELDSRRDPILRSILDGLRHAAGHLGLAGMFVSLAVISLLARPVLELLPNLADILGLGAAGFGFLTAVIGAGAMVGGIWLAGYGTPRRLARLGLANGFIAAGALGLAAISSRLVVAIPALFVLGFAMVVAGIASQTLIQLNAGQKVRGRLLSLHSLIFRGGPALGALVLGGIADLVTLRVALVGAAIICALSSARLWHFRHRIWESFESPRSAPKPDSSK